MFGYVIADGSRLSDEDKNLYRAYYCGVCRALTRQHGVMSDLALNYDLVFLAMLLDSVYDTEPENGKGRCLIHPVRERGYVKSAHVDYAADMSVALMYYKFADDWMDDHNPLRLMESRLIRGRVRLTEKRYPKQCGVIRSCLADLRGMEKRDERVPDRPAACFGALMGSLFAVNEDAYSACLWEMGNRLGQFIYLCDAVIDLKEDLKKKRYNPLTGLPGGGDMTAALCACMDRCTQCFDLLPVKRYRAILEDILYSGVWTKWKQHQLKLHGRNDETEDPREQKGGEAT